MNLGFLEYSSNSQGFGLSGLSLRLVRPGLLYGLHKNCGISKLSLVQDYLGVSKLGSWEVLLGTSIFLVVSGLLAVDSQVRDSFFWAELYLNPRLPKLQARTVLDWHPASWFVLGLGVSMSPAG